MSTYCPTNHFRPRSSRLQNLRLVTQKVTSQVVNELIIWKTHERNIPVDGERAHRIHCEYKHHGWNGRMLQKTSNEGRSPRVFLEDGRYDDAPRLAKLAKSPGQ